ncbi:MAG: SufD family Fe-S cluster assembly protein [Candidatus Micrarchaeota archaeon]|nr:SufD family Fe-S cluster assembly protein [Candidatus Micrarchaeota archaeon]
MPGNKEFIEEAMRYYRELPLESGLYKKYSIEMPLDTPDPKGADADINAIAEEISSRMRIRFDAVVSSRSAVSTNQDIVVKKVEELDSAAINGKLFKSSEDKLAAFINSKARHFVIVNAKSGVDKKLNILFINDGNLPVQILVDAADNSRLEILEFYTSASKERSVVAPLHEIKTGKGAHVEVDMVHNENDKTYLVGLCKAIAGDRSRVKLNFVYSGAVATKSRNILDSNGEKNGVEVNEIVFGINDQKFDVSTFIANKKPFSSAMINSGAVLDGEAYCVMKGFAKVENGSKGAFSKITERGILLSMDSHIDALPDMSIDYSNEVKATHSAATSPIDQEALFYLTSRGIPDEAARKLFVTSFLARYLLNMDSGIAKELAMSIMLDKLERKVYGGKTEMTTKGIWMVANEK